MESSLHWIKNPAENAPVWLEKSERIAALAMLTVLGLLVTRVIQRQGCLYLITHDHHPNSGSGLAHVQGD